MATVKILEKYYNCKITDDNGNEYYVFSNTLHNNNLHHCFVGVDTLLIDFDSKVYDGICQSNCLGDLNTETVILPSSPIICKMERCTSCTQDLMTKKHQLTGDIV